jgi:HK97 family phage portal protein
MGLFADVWNPAPRASVGWEPLDDRWYTNDLGFSASGDAAVALTADGILRCGTVLAAVRFRGDSVAMCPPSTYLIQGERRVVDAGHYSHRVLRNPNAWMTGNRWRHLMGVWMATWGNAYSEIVADRDSFAGELRPISPAHIRIRDQRTDGTLMYEYARPGRAPRELPQERVLHFRDIGTDGLQGLAMYQLIRNAVNIALAAEQHLGTFLRKGSRLSGLVTPSTPLEKDQRDALRSALNKELGGASNTGAFGVLPFGVEVKPVASTNREAQLSELSDQQVGAILRFLGVPGVVAGYADKTATYASAKEFFESGGIKHCVLPILTNMEAEEEKSLLLPGDGRQIKHNLDALLRANWKDRMAGLVQAVGGPFMSVNEARDIEDMDAIEGERYDQPHIPSNMAGAADTEEPAEAPPQRRRSQTATPAEDEEEARVRARGWQFALDAAGRVVRREIAAIRDRAPLAARDPEGWREWVSTYYGRHAAHVAETLHLDEPVARQYAEGQRDALLTEGLAQCETWHETIPYRLASMAYGD